MEMLITCIYYYTSHVISVLSVSELVKSLKKGIFVRKPGRGIGFSFSLSDLKLLFSFLRVILRFHFRRWRELQSGILLG